MVWQRVRQRTEILLRDGLRAFRASATALLHRWAVRRVLVLGDSHVRVFEHWLFPLAMPRTRFEIVHVPGATAIGIGNPHSASDARNRFEAALDAGSWDRVLVNLGEVDAAISLWIVADKRGEPIDVALDRAVGRYLAFLERVHAEHRLIVLAATLPTLSDASGIEDAAVARHRSQVTATKAQRTALTMDFNRRVGEWCAARGVPHLDTAAEALGSDGLVRESWTVRGAHDHHYARRPYARALVRMLGPLVKHDGPTVG